MMSFFMKIFFPSQNDSISKNIVPLSCITVDDDVYLKNTVESFIENEILNEISSHTTSYSSSFPINNLPNEPLELSPKSLTVDKVLPTINVQQLPISLHSCYSTRPRNKPV